MYESMEFYAASDATKKLTKKEQIALAERIQRGKNSTNEEEIQDGLKARQELIEGNVRLVLYIAKGFINPEHDLEELIGEAMIGLIAAVDRFDPSKGVSFSTYAYPWIRKYIFEAMADKRKELCIPDTFTRNLKRYNVAVDELTQTLNRVPTDDEVREKLGWGVDRFEGVLAALKVINRDNLEDAEGEEIEMIDETMDVEKEALSDIASKNLLDFLRTFLTEKEVTVLANRYGIGEDLGENRSLEAVGKIMGYTRERIRQIEKEAMKKIKDYVEANNLSMADFDFSL